MKIENLEPLVKLANLGAAGISVLAVFIIGTKIFNLSNDTSKNKVSVLKFYMAMCIFMTIICGISGVANAYFNYQKAKDAKKDLTELGNRYETERIQWVKYKADVQKNLVSLKAELSNISSTPTNVSNNINRLESGIEKIQLKSKDEMMKDLGSNRLIKQR